MGRGPRPLEHLGRVQTLGLNRAFWEGRRVLVTGHTGFMGGWLALWLGRLGAVRAGYALAAPTKPSLFEVTGLGADMASITADIRDLGRLTATMREFEPEIVLHLAAQPLVRRAHADPVETFGTNVMGTVNVLQAIRVCESVKAAVIVTTDKVYDNHEWDWAYRENDRLGGNEPYGASKAAAEMAVAAFRGAYFDPESGAAGRRVGIGSVRAGNIIGGGDWAENRLVPDAIRSFTAGKPLILRYPESVRPWQHVMDPLHGFLILAERLYADPARWSGAWNFGPDDSGATTVGTLAARLASLWGDTAQVESHANDGPHESRHLTLTSAQARSRLGWAPLWPLERALAATVGWYRAHLDRRDMREVTFEQIASFEGAN